MSKSIYMAGKIAKGDWRHEMVHDLRGVLLGSCGEFIGDRLDHWPVLEPPSWISIILGHFLYLMIMGVFMETTLTVLEQTQIMNIVTRVAIRERQ